MLSEELQADGYVTRYFTLMEEEEQNSLQERVMNWESSNVSKCKNPHGFSAGFCRQIICAPTQHDRNSVSDLRSLITKY